MTKQEIFNNARNNLNSKLGVDNLDLSYVTTENRFIIKTEIFYNNKVITVGFSTDKLEDNDRYLESAIEAIANFDLSLIPK